MAIPNPKPLSGASHPPALPGRREELKLATRGRTESEDVAIVTTDSLLADSLTAALSGSGSSAPPPLPGKKRQPKVAAGGKRLQVTSCLQCRIHSRSLILRACWQLTGLPDFWDAGKRTALGGAVYTVDPEEPAVNGRPHWSNGKGGHIYFFPAYGQWLINSHFSPDEAGADAGHETDGPPPEGSALWNVWSAASHRWVGVQLCLEEARPEGAAISPRMPTSLSQGQTIPPRLPGDAGTHWREPTEPESELWTQSDTEAKVKADAEQAKAKAKADAEKQTLEFKADSDATRTVKKGMGLQKMQAKTSKVRTDGRKILQADASVSKQAKLDKLRSITARRATGEAVSGSEGMGLDRLEASQMKMEVAPPAPTGDVRAYFEEWGVEVGLDRRLA